MSDRVRMIAAIALLAAPLILLGFSLYQITLPDVVTIVVTPAVPAIEDPISSREMWMWTSMGATILTGIAAIVAAVIASEMDS